ncbi:MAG: DUF4352 domain-containing protein [Candidatus Pristimantibacillus lignocellulolyticus]|uniref:DUF4352 domain-containing protein n=1 Tax=Candidatus Pristimantibacillus lignocellulolyticus TaxID=2994561 RepID=A0A9J6ZFT4_9BACL|nr:MAG: DUF4352 domain-containing protein [Candidatus Pristimantibacillus lignocellulolyticus]
MKKTYLMIITLVALIIISGCAGTKPNNNSTNATPTPTPDASEETTPTPEPTEEPNESEASYAQGDKFTLGEWDITLDSFEFNKEVSDDIFTSSAEEGNKFIVLNYTVLNNGKESSTFTGMLGSIKMKALYKDEYEYGSTTTMIDGDLSKSTVKPLSSKTGFVVIEVPDVVADTEDSLVLSIDNNGEKAQIKLR